MSDLLSRGLQTSRNELEAGLAEAEAELTAMRERCHELEALIAVGKATLSAAQLNPSTIRTPMKPMVDIRTEDASSLRAAPLPK